MTEKELLLGVLSKTLNLDETGAMSLLYNSDGSLKDDAEALLLSKDAERVSTLKGASKEALADRYSAGKKETMEGFEKSIKEKFDLKGSKAQGIDLIVEAVAARTQAPKAEDIAEEVVKKTPAYRSLEQAMQEKLDELKNDWSGKLTAEQAKWQKERNLDHVMSAAQQIFDAMKPNLSSDPVRARNQKRLFEQDVRALSTEVQAEADKKVIVLLGKDGKSRLEDAHGVPVKFEDAVKTIIEQNYDLPAAAARSTAGSPIAGTNGNGSAGTGSTFQLTKPTSREDYARQLGELQQITDLKEQVKQTQQLQVLAKEAGVV